MPHKMLHKIALNLVNIKYVINKSNITYLIIIINNFK